MNFVGLTSEEAVNRLAAHGPNEITLKGRSGLGELLFRTVREPMIGLLLACSVIYFFLGDTAEAILLAVSIAVILFIHIYQERKTERTLESLRKLSSPRTIVLRDGQKQRIPSRNLVPGDVIYLEEGDRISADAKIISSNGLLIDESLLTGESVPVRKQALQDPLLFSGTLVNRGHAVAEVTTTANQTKLGSIGKSVSLSIEEPTRLQTETKQLVRIFGSLGFALCVLIAIIATKRLGNWMEGTLLGIATAMSLLPEEFPVILTIFLAMGAWRISKKNVLTRKIPALENLGTITTLCVDKTGTLTQNKMTVKSVVTDAKTWTPGSSLGPDFQNLLTASVLSSPTDSNDPMEVALHELQRSNKIELPGQLDRVYPLSDNLFAMTCVWKTSSGSYEIYAKGAPEAVLDLCHLDRKIRTFHLDRAKSLAAQGLRVLGVGTSSWNEMNLPESQHDFDFEFLGFVTFEDPIRPEARESIAQCYGAGIRVVMITGDHPATAESIARQLLLKNPDRVLTGDNLREMNDLELAQEIKVTNVFARTRPEQKMRLVNALKANGEIVAMTGDGVNDVPSLKWANVGIAMGNRGSDVARETADLVLTDDNFSSIVSAIRLGRRIFENIRRAMLYVLAVHVPIAGLATVPIVLGLPVFLLPAHILLLELIIDPASSLVFEAEPTEVDMMSRPPRPSHEKIVQLKPAVAAFTKGLFIWGAVFVIFVYFWDQSKNAETARTLGFITLVVGNLGLIFSFRAKAQIISYKAHSSMWILTGAVTMTLILLLSIPFLRNLFHFTTVELNSVLIAIAAGVVSMVAVQGVRYAYDRHLLSFEPPGANSV